MRRLSEEDYRRDAVTVAKALLGAALCRRLDDGTVLRARITETEAYCGEGDTACHAHKGRTPRTDVMYAPGGCAYIYLCYGMHEMLNVVTGPAERPEAVLIRGVEGAEGPGRLTKALHISRALNREDLVFASAPRIGIGYASKRDQARKWRFTVIAGKCRPQCLTSGGGCRRSRALPPVGSVSPSLHTDALKKAPQNPGIRYGSSGRNGRWSR